MRFGVLAVTCAMLLMGLAPPGGGSLEGDGPDLGRAEVRFLNATPSAGLAGVGGNFFAWGDLDADGHQDLLVDGKRLFRNEGPPYWKFTEVTDPAGIGGSGVNTGNWADYDNDGFLDIFCPSGGWSTDFDPRWDVLWHNEGDGTFKNVTEAAGHVTDTFPSVAAGWGDCDRDGFVDLYVANYENASMESAYPDVFWRNDGDGTFTNATVAAGLDERDRGDIKPGRGVSWCDYNDDGWPDIYISNYRLTDNYLYENDRDGTFTNVAFNKNVAGEASYRLGAAYFGHSVGSAWSDIDDDGDFDLWVTNLAHKDLYRGPICDDSELYMSNGSAGNYTFQDIRSTSGIPVKRILGGEDELFVGCAWGDYDNDGYQDLFLPQIYNDIPYASSFLFRNNGNRTFTDASEEAGIRVWDTYGGAWCDYDEDGDLDLVTGGKGSADINATHEVHLYENQLNDQGTSSWLELRLVGTRSNRAAIGCRVTATAGGLTQMREVEGGMGPHSMQNSLTVCFGFPGSPSKADVRIAWPSGTLQELKGQVLGRILTVTEGSGSEPDLSVEDVTFEPRSPLEGQELTITTTLRNLGPAPATSARLRLYDGAVSPGDLLPGSEIMIKLGAGAFASSPFVWKDTAGRAGVHEIFAVVDEVKPSDSDISNNELGRSVVIGPSGGTEPPVARLSVSPDRALVGEPVQLDASASSDPDGTVVQFEFFFGDGATSGWTAFSVVSHAYSLPGSYSAGVRVKDNSSTVSPSDARAGVIINLPPNMPPTARISSILPNPARAGQAVSFIGDANDEDGTISANEWTSSLDGPLSSERDFESASLSTGKHVISFRVQDDRGEWSSPVSRNLEVTAPPANQPPSAFIESIHPNPALVGETVRLTGRGEDPDGKVVDHEWRSSRDGSLGRGRVIETASLSVGTHAIFLKVQDDDGAWSSETFSRAEVKPLPEQPEANRAPSASLSASRVSVMINEVVRLDGSPSSDPDGRVVEYFFDHGDGTQTGWTLADSVSHAYNVTGEYAARLRVRDDKGLPSTWSREVVIEVKGPRAASAPRGAIPGFETSFLALALLAGVSALGRARRPGL